MVNARKKLGTIWHIGGEDVHMRIPILKCLAESGYEVAAVGSDGKSRFEDENISFYHYDLARNINPGADIKSFMQLRALFLTHRPSIVHSFDTKPNIIAPIAACRVEGIQSVRTLNGMGNIFSESTLQSRCLQPVYRGAQRLVKPLTSHLVFQNEDDQQYFSSHGLSSSKNSSLIHGSGIDESQFAHVDRTQNIARLRQELSLGDAKIVVMIARLVRNKGVVEFMEAARRVRLQSPDTKFLLVGPSATEGAHAVSDDVLQGYKDDVLILGKRNDVATILSAADLFVLPSYYREGVPRALLEAAASGLPLVATDMPGCRDVLQYGGVGTLIPPRDSDALSAAIMEIISDITQWQKLAASAANHVFDEFGLQAIAKKHIDLYRTLLS